MAQTRIQAPPKDADDENRKVGSFRSQVGEMATELRRIREAKGPTKRRSPVDVVLDGRR